MVYPMKHTNNSYNFIFSTTMMDILMADNNSIDKSDPSWMYEHELYEEAEQYAEEHDVHASEVFPNPLVLEYDRNPEAFSEEEQKYIDKMLAFIEAFQRMDPDAYEQLKEELKEELHIKDSFNPFEEVK